MILCIDWGSSNRRAYLLDTNGDLVKKSSDGSGVFTPEINFADSLRDLIKSLGVMPGKIIMSGMIGSRSGWVEAPYTGIPANLAEIKNNLVRVPFGAAETFIVPGMCDTSNPDVMRGEETQLLGGYLLENRSGTICLPGTHSKWAHIENGVLSSFKTFMTGELFSLLTAHGSLAAIIERNGQNQDAFIRGIKASLNRQALSSQLFSIRAEVLLGELGSKDAGAYLSGLLIGSEFSAGNSLLPAAGSGITIIGEPELAELYRTAAGFLGFKAVTSDPETVFITAMKQIGGLS